MLRTEPRFKRGDVVAFAYGVDVLMGTVFARPREAPDAEQWLYPLELVDGRRFPAYEDELQPGGTG